MYLFLTESLVTQNCPLWIFHFTESGGSTSSLIILQQLKDKQKAHEYIINFLKKLSLWDKVSKKNWKVINIYLTSFWATLVSDGKGGWFLYHYFYLKNDCNCTFTEFWFAHVYWLDCLRMLAVSYKGVLFRTSCTRKINFQLV